MTVPPESATEEIKRLQRCISDLISIIALPAVWVGGDCFQIVYTVLDALLGMLSLEFVYARLMETADATAFEVVRIADTQSPLAAADVGRMFSEWLGADPQSWPSSMHNPFGDGIMSIVALRAGLQGEIGVIVAGSRRTDFPRQTEKLLLGVAASQMTIGLQEARLLGEHKRLADELDQKVALRTRELAAANEDLRLQIGILQQIPEAVWTVGSDGSPDFENRIWLEYTGQTLDYIQSHPEAWLTALHPEDRGRASRIFWNGIRSGQGFTMEARVRRARDGAYRWHLNRAVALHDADGNILRFVGTSTDIEDLRQSQDNLRDTQAELAHVTRMMAMGALTASIAHEVSQPLSGIITNASTCLRMLGADPPDIEGALQTARRTIRDANRASNVIGRLGALFRKQQSTTEPVDLNEATREVLVLSERQLLRDRVVLRQALADDLPLVAGDRVQLQQVILNLVLNAVDAMSGIEGRPRSLMIATRRDENNGARLAVQDSGIGIDPQTMERIFQAFYTTKSDGMGIGLFVSRSIVESHQGRIWATSNEGPGATFSFTIPTLSGHVARTDDTDDIETQRHAGHHGED